MFDLDDESSFDWDCIPSEVMDDDNNAYNTKNTVCNSSNRTVDPANQLADMTSIRKTMDARRTLMQRQQEADAIKSRMCDQIRADRDSISPLLAKKVAQLEHTDPHLFTYIRRLEFIQSGIWCNTCNTIKNINYTTTPENKPMNSRSLHDGSRPNTNVRHYHKHDPAAIKDTAIEQHYIQSLKNILQQVDAIRDGINTLIMPHTQPTHTGKSTQREKGTNLPTESARTRQHPRIPQHPPINISTKDLPTRDLEYIDCTPDKIDVDELLAEVNID